MLVNIGFGGVISVFPLLQPLKRNVVNNNVAITRYFIIRILITLDVAIVVFFVQNNMIYLMNFNGVAEAENKTLCCFV